LPQVASAALPHVPLAVVTRGDAIDSVHYGSVAVVDRGGRVLFAAGNPHI
jgi:L-asparaginase II